MQPYQNYIQTYLQANIQSPIRSNSPFSPNNTKNLNILSNKPITMTQSPSISFMFQVPKQKANTYFNYVGRTPSPSYNRRNFINLNDNTKFKEASNSSVIYKKLPGMDSIRELQTINQKLGNISPKHLNFKPSDNKDLNPFYITPLYINFEQKVPRVARTPEPTKRNNINNIQSSNQNNINSFLTNDINININNITIYNDNTKYFYNNPFNNYQNKEAKTLYNNRNQTKQLSDLSSNYLKPNNNISIIKSNDINQNKNYENIINIRKTNIQNTKFGNIIIKKVNNYNPYFNYQNNIHKNKPDNNYRHNHYHSNFLNSIHNNSNSFQNVTNSQNESYYQNNKSYIKIDDNFKNNNYQNNIKVISNSNQLNQSNFQMQNYQNENYKNLYLTLNQNITPNIPQNHIKIIPIPQNKNIHHFVEKGIIRKTFKDIVIARPTPSDDFNIKEFQIMNQIGEGTFGKIYIARWNKTNELYALKKLELFEDELNSFRKKVKIIQNLMKKTGTNGIIKIYGDKLIPQKKPNEYHYYILMELGDKDWEREILMRKSRSLYYTEYELFAIIIQLVKTLSLMQKNKVTHRDIKPQNIIICKNVFKICDFDEIKILEENGPILQPVRGSELYMSPILFYAYNSKVYNVLHNTYKSDVFSLGMTIFLAASLSAKPLCDIRELKDMNLISYIINNTLNTRYSQNLINLIIKMLQIDENLRCDFIELEGYISVVWPN